MLKNIIKAITPQFVLHEWHKAKFNPKLVAMGIKPRPACRPVEYLGTEYGGHAVDVAMVSNNSVVYTLGAGLDISFEEELINRTGCHVHVFDPTPRSVAWLNERFNSIESPHPLATKISIHPMGIWSSDQKLRFFAPKNPENVSYSLTNLQGTNDYIEVDCVSLKSAMCQNGHDHIDLVKLNVEGAEYSILNSAFDDGIMPKMILINYDEVHTEGDDQAPQRLKQIASRIDSLGYRVAFAELARVTYTL